MFKIINRTTGFIILPNKIIVPANRSALVENINEELMGMEKAKIITIHSVEKKDCCWTKFCIDPICVPKNDDAPDLVPIESGPLALSFKNGRDTEICFEIELPPNYVVGSDLLPTIDWKVIDPSNYGNVTWVIEFMALQNWILFKKEKLIHSAPIPITKKVITIDLPKISGGGFKYNTLIQGRLIRRGSEDTYDLPAVVPAFDIYYQIEKNNVKTWVANN